MRYREEPEGNYILSYEPAKLRTIYVETEQCEVKEIFLPLPTLVLLGKRKEFYLWAAKAQPVTAKTRLAISLLTNNDGDLSVKICFGKNEVPQCGFLKKN